MLSAGKTFVVYCKLQGGYLKKIKNKKIRKFADITVGKKVVED